MNPVIPLNFSLGTIHFVGIGGIGMSGIAEILHNLGYSVQGSDLSENANVARLREKGIKIFASHSGKNVENSSVVVKSTAVPFTNPEIEAARKLHIPVVRRSEMLAELMRLKLTVGVAGTHGKTTTTSMVSYIFEANNLNPTVINGGILNAYGTNAYLGDGDWMIVEADESDGTFIKLPTTVGIITNMDPEHLDYYGTYEKMKEAYHTFVSNIPFYGFAVLCIDHPEVQKLSSEVLDRKIITYGTNPQADIRAVNIESIEGGSKYDVIINGETIEGIELPIVGLHNIQNSLAAIGVASGLGFPTEVIFEGFKQFKGVKRRFTKVADVNGVTIIDDYAHHPIEIQATLKAARQYVDDGKVIAIFQPHRYSRVQDLWDDFCACFNEANTVYIADIFAAGEKPIEGISRESLVEGIAAVGHKDVSALKSPADIEAIVNGASAGDIVLFMGAGTITKWANEFGSE